MTLAIADSKTYDFLRNIGTCTDVKISHKFSLYRKRRVSGIRDHPM